MTTTTSWGLVPPSSGNLRAAASTAELRARLTHRLAALEAELAALRPAAAARGPEVSADILAAVQAAAAEVDARSMWLRSGGDDGRGGSGGFDGRPFIAGADDVFRLEFSGLLQWRFTAGRLGADAAGDDRTEAGFEGRRLRFGVRGTAVDPRLAYRVSFGSPRNGSDVGLTNAYLEWDEGDGHGVWRVGRFRPAFAREERTSARRLPMIERSVAFRLGRQSRRAGVSYAWTGDRVRMFGAVHDDDDEGLDASWSATGRVEWRGDGTWRGARSETGRPGDDPVFVAGLAGQWIAGRDQVRAWLATADAVIKGDGWSMSTAVIVREPDARSGGGGGSGGSSEPAWSAMLRGGVFTGEHTELVARVEVGDARTAGGPRDELLLVTAGANWYLAGDRLRLQADIGYAFDGPGDAWSVGGTGWRQAGGDGQVVFRTQFTLHF